MISLLLPRALDNRFRGQWLGFWLLAPVLLLKIAIALGSILTPANAFRADGIDLSGYPAAALREATSSTALLGLLHLSIGLMGALAMIRYRSMVPLIQLWLLIEFAGRRVVLGLYPIDRTPGPSGGAMLNTALLAMMALGLGLSLWRRRDAPAAPGG